MSASTEAAISPADLGQGTGCVERCVRIFGDRLVMSTSFGIQSAALLHMAVSVAPRMPIVWIDTGYLPEETYRYARTLSERLDLNLHVYQSNLSPARMEALYGRLWETGRSDDLDRYHHIRKVEPMQRALRELGASAWLSGVRRSQTGNRRTLPLMSVQWGVVKVHPLLDWSDEDVQRYLADHDLPRHPLEYRGYRTVGDRHLSRPEETEDTDGRRTRFRGLREECGLHVPERTGTSIPIIPLDLRNEPESE